MSTNDYFDNPNDQSALPKGQTARAEAVDAKFDAITTGLDKLPTQAQNNRGTRNLGTDGGAADAYTIGDLAHIAGALADGQEAQFIATNASLTTTPTLDVTTASNGPVVVVYNDGSALAIGDIPLNGMVSVRYNDTTSKWNLISVGPASAVASAASAAAASTSASNASTSATNAATSLAAMSAYLLKSFSATPDFDLNAQVTMQMPVTAAITDMTTSNRAAGRGVDIILIADGTDRLIALNSNWIVIGTPPATLPANKAGVLSLRCKGTAETDVLAIWGREF